MQESSAVINSTLLSAATARSSGADLLPEKFSQLLAQSVHREAFSRGEEELHDRLGGDLPTLPPEGEGWRALGSWAVRGLIAPTVLGVGGWWLTRASPVQCAQLWQGELREEAFGTGTLEAKVVIGFSAKIIGKVVEVLVESRYHHRVLRVQKRISHPCYVVVYAPSVAVSNGHRKE